MSNEQEAKNQDPKNVENEPQTIDELAPEDLDQVVGGTASPTQPPPAWMSSVEGGHATSD